MGMKLFDGSDSDNDDLAKIEVDKEFARRYEHNKKREDLQRYEELKKKGLIDEEDEDSLEESSSSDDDVSVDLKKEDLEFFEALIKVRKQDPSLKNKDVKLFESESDSDENQDGKGQEEEENGDPNKQKKNKKKAMYLKDVIAKHLIDEDDRNNKKNFVNNEEQEEIEGLENSDEDDRNNKKTFVYNEEQEEIRKAFLEAVEGNDLEEKDGDLLRVKEKNVEDLDGSDNEEFQKKLDEYFGGGQSSALDENANFLRQYFMNKMWIGKSNNDAAKDVGVTNEELDILSEDEKEIEKQEDYEYRHQENPYDRVVGHSRQVENSVRNEVKARKEQRKRKEERMETARLEREEELRHLKNLKKKEMDDRVKKIMASAGIRDDEIVPLSTKELEDEFDPDEYDTMMKKAFGDNYYDAEDADPTFGSDADEDVGDFMKPDFDKEDELLGLPKGWDSCETGDDGFLATRERTLKLKMENDGEAEEVGEAEGGEAEEVTEEEKQKRKHKSAILEKAKEAMLEEYYKLDYEDTIGDLKTRFKYAKIKPNRYGLSGAEILMMDDKELNEYVSLKKIAPYKDKEWKVPNSKRYQFKCLTKERLHGGKPSEQKHSKKKRKRVDANKPTSSDVVAEDGKLQLEQSAGEVSHLSRKARRRRNQSKFKLAETRSGAYQKQESKPKKKRKH